MGMPIRPLGYYLTNYVEDVNGCRYFVGYKGPVMHRRPATKKDGKTLLIARAAFEAVNGPIPSGLLVCHKCDNESCINPEHLFLGTHDDNSKDMVAKKRNRVGSAKTESKLTEGQVAQIRADYKPYITSMPKLAAKYGVTRSTIQFALKGYRWKHVPDPVPNRIKAADSKMCHKGHELTGDNIIQRSNGRLSCKRCQRDYQNDPAKRERYNQLAKERCAAKKLIAAEGGEEV